MEKLTKKQEEVLDCIKEFIANYGFPPTVREICKAKNLSSPSTVQMHLNSLAEKGYLKKDKAKSRTIELIVENEYLNKKNDIMQIPFKDSQKNEYINIPYSIVPKNDNLFAYLVKNNDLINHNILKNDIVIIQKQKTITNNDIGVYIEENKIIFEKTKNSEIFGKIVSLYRNIKS